MILRGWKLTLSLVHPLPLTVNDTHNMLTLTPLHVFVVRAFVWGSGRVGSIPDRVSPHQRRKTGRFHFELLGLALSTNGLDNRLAGSESVKYPEWFLSTHLWRKWVGCRSFGPNQDGSKLIHYTYTHIRLHTPPNHTLSMTVHDWLPPLSLSLSLDLSRSTSLDLSRL